MASRGVKVQASYTGLQGAIRIKDAFRLFSPAKSRKNPKLASRVKVVGKRTCLCYEKREAGGNQREGVFKGTWP